jgi:tetratricopeptide (TPR) repeat protein
MVTSALASRLLQDAMDMHRRGAIADAAARYSQILKFEPKNVDALCLLGLACSELKRFTEAVEFLRKAVKLAPKHAPAHNFLGAALKEMGRTDEALARFERAITLQPDFMDAYVNRADLLMRLNRWAEAVETYDRALAARPDFFQGWCNRGVALERMARLEDAVASYERAIALRPDLTAAHANRGNALAALGRHQAAVESFDRALATKPDFAELHLNRGNSLARLARREEALASYDRALAIKPDMAEAEFGRGTVLREENRFEEAVACFDRAIKLSSNDAIRAVFHLHRAETLNELARFREGLADAQRSLELAPSNDEVLYGVSMIELLHGRWLEAWPRYERRLALKVGIPPDFSPPAWPQWDGEVLRDELLVLRGEQGLGDHINFAMLGSHLAKLGYRIALWTDPILKSVLEPAIGVEHVVSDVATLQGPGAIRWTSMMSVPGLLGITPDTIPEVSPYLAADPGCTAVWKERFGTENLKVGIVWAGNQANIRGRRRSVPIERLAPLFAIAGIRWFSLQVGERAGDVARLPASTITDLSPLLTDFCQTAGAIAALDLVISIDTAVAHLAGALAKPVWILLPLPPDWRWLLDRDDTRWYPTARLFRQLTAGDWESVCARVAAALCTLAH